VIHRVTQMPVRSPFLIRNMAHEPWRHPNRRRVWFGALVEWAGILLQGGQHGMEFLQLRVAEARSDVANVNELLFLIRPQQQGTDPSGGSLGFIKSANDGKLFALCLDLKPVAAARSFLVWTVRPLGDDPF